MRRIVLIAFTTIIISTAAYAAWPPAKSYDAGDVGSPNALHFNTANGSFPGWSPNDTLNLTELAPNAAGLVAGDTGASTKVVTGKVKYRTSNWTFNAADSVKTGFIWRLFIASGETDKWPSISIRAHQITYTYKGVVYTKNINYGLAFSTDVTGGSWCQSLPGWRFDADNDNRDLDGNGQDDLFPPGQIDFGGAIIPAGPDAGKRYLPMSMDQWHTLRVEVRSHTVSTDPGVYDVYLDEELGGSDAHKITLSTRAAKNGPFIEFGVRSSSNSCRFYTNFVAWGQDSEIPALPFTTSEICGNGIDDDGVGGADCNDTKCSCAAPVPENEATACSNGIDDDKDGLIDCNDPDCAGVTHCADNQPQFVVTSIRQLGHGQGGTGDSNWPGENGGTSMNVYVSVYDESGQAVTGLEIRDPLNCVSLGAHADNDPPAGQVAGGFYRQIDLIKGVTRTFMVTKMNGAAVNSEVATVVGNPADNDFGWLIEFMKKSAKSDRGSFNPLTRVFDYSGVQLHAAGGGANTTLNRDACNTGGAGSPGSTMFVQTFKVPEGVNRIVSARVMTQIGGGNPNYHSNKLSIHPLLNVPPQNINDLGTRIGPTKASHLFTNDASAWIEQMVTWPSSGTDSVSVTPGQYYALKIERGPGGTGTDINVQRLRIGNYAQDIDPGTNKDRIVGLRMLTDNYTLQYDDGTNATGGPAGVQNYDYRAYIVGGNFAPCGDPVFDVRRTDDSPGSDGRVDIHDLVAFMNCATGPTPNQDNWDALSQECRCLDINGDKAIDITDFGVFQRCYTGNNPATLNPNCDNL
jgi:hypothetical protein